MTTTTNTSCSQNIVAFLVSNMLVTPGVAACMYYQYFVIPSRVMGAKRRSGRE